MSTFIDRLDPMKLYFLEEDIKSFHEKKLELDDMLKKGELQFAHDVFLQYMSRMETSIKVVHTLIDQEHDFTVDEYISTDWDNLKFATSQDELTDRWRKRIPRARACHTVHSEGAHVTHQIAEAGAEAL